MRSPWLEIPLSDYESHMALPAVGQAEMLASELEETLLRFAPASVAVIGCAGGNGFDRIPAKTQRVVGADINPEYIAAAAARFLGRIPGLELHVADIEVGPLPFAPVELIFAGLVFEYVALPAALANLARVCCPDGRLVAVLQEESAQLEAVTPSPYSSLQTLAPRMRLVPSAELAARAADAGFSIESERSITLESGKQFTIQVYRHAAD